MLRGLHGVTPLGPRLIPLGSVYLSRASAAGGLCAFSTGAGQRAKENGENDISKSPLKPGLGTKDRTRPASLKDELSELMLVPLGTPQTLDPTPLEKQDAELQKQMRQLKDPERFKVGRNVSPSMTWYRWPWHTHLHKGKPIKKLTVPKVTTSGRNNTGHVVNRHRGGGAKRRIRLVDFFRREGGIHTVVRIEYDPGRTAHLALLRSPTDTYSYIPATVGMRAGDEVESFLSGLPAKLLQSTTGFIDPGALAAVTARRGNCLPLRLVPLGAIISNIGIQKGGPARLCRSAGTFGRLFEKLTEQNRAAVRLASGEMRYVALDACATIGINSNPSHRHRMLGKAGRARNMGRRPRVRGTAMNKVDHPHGGGRGKSKGNKIPVSPWGKPTKAGYITRRGKNVNRLLIRGRPRGRQGATVRMPR